MKEQYINFTLKRMYIFNELVKRYWSGRLNTKEDLEELASHIKTKYGFEDSEMTFIKDHIRIAMGQEPKGDTDFSDELDFIRNSEKVRGPVVARVDGPCEFCDKKDCQCQVAKYETDIYRRSNGPVIQDGKCLSCGRCVGSCDFGGVVDKIEFMPVIELLKDKDTPVFAAVAPAITGQFGDNVSMGQLRTAFKLMGFEDMIEVAMFADILTIKEAIEFNDRIKTEEDFLLTSCCCPVWFNMIKKSYPDIRNHMSLSVSPMIAAGRILKRLYKNSKVVFFAPCIAKKAEYKDLELTGAVDYVVNFRELKEVFDALDIELDKLSPADKDQASMGGRLYARTGGVSFSVKTIVNRFQPDRVIKLKAKKVDGVKKCKDILDSLNKGEKLDANFVEGMGCIGGCVGGPRTNISVEKATEHVNEYGEDSFILTPFDNQNILKIFNQIGIESMEELLENEEMDKLLTRDF